MLALGWLRWVLVLTLVTYVGIRLTDWIVFEPLVAVAENEARDKGIAAINRIALTNLSNTKYEDLVVYEKDKDGHIAAYHINTGLVNKIASEAAVSVREEFRRLSTEKFGIPLGTLTGSRILATHGPVIPVPLIPVGTVIVDIQQSFKSEGINQTRHSIWLHATARVRVVLPFVSREVEVTYDMPVTDTVIVGAVPTSYYGGNLGGVSLPVK